MQLIELIQQAETEIAQAQSLPDLDQVRVRYLGKKGLLTEYLKTLGNLSPAERPKAGQAVNAAKESTQAALDARRGTLEDAALSSKLAAESLDITLPGRGQATGGLRLSDSYSQNVAVEPSSLAARRPL